MQLDCHYPPILTVGKNRDQLIVITLKAFRYRLTLLQACLYLFSGSVFALTLEVSGSPSPSEMQCPKLSYSAAKNPRVQQEVLEPPIREEVEESINLPEEYVHQHVRPAVTSHTMPPSIGIWGDSHLAAGFLTDELVAALGLNKEDATPGFLPPTMGRGGVRLPIKKFCKSSGWRLANAYVARGKLQKFGPALTRLENIQDDTSLWVDFRYQNVQPALQQLTILFGNVREQPVVLEVKVDDSPSQQIELKEGENRLHLYGKLPFSQLRLRVISGSLGIEGFAPVYVSHPHLKLDIFGIPGATAHSWQVIDPFYLRKRLNSDDYNIVILEYGTNEGADRNFDAEKYKAALAGSLQGMKAAFPNSQCLLIGPTDRGVLVKKQRQSAKKKTGSKIGNNAEPVLREQILKYASIHARIAEIQKSLAQTNGCGFWDWQLAMGGPGSAYRWFFRNPPLMAKDLTHLTRMGYQKSARMFVSDMGIAEWLK